MHGKAEKFTLVTLPSWIGRHRQPKLHTWTSRLEKTREMISDNTKKKIRETSDLVKFFANQCQKSPNPQQNRILTSSPCPFFCRTHINSYILYRYMYLKFYFFTFFFLLTAGLIAFPSQKCNCEKEVGFGKNKYIFFP